MSAAKSPNKRKLPAWAAGNESKKKHTVDESPRICIQIKGLEDGNKFMFTSKMRTPLKELIIAYSNLVSVDVSENRFFFKGREITPENTPEALGMKDGAKICALHCQCGTDKSPPITVAVVSLCGKKVFCRIKKDTPLYKLKETYCDIEHFDSRGSCRFIYNGRIMQDDRTPNELGMKDGDIVHFVLCMVGS